MNTAKEKWKRTYRKALSRKYSHESLSGSNTQKNQEIDKMELHSYLNTMKQKTSLLNLWSGSKFENIFDNDRTPDISLSSGDDDIDSKIKNLQMMNLDSDEDEMRKDYLREMKDENNNSVSSASYESLDLMGNMQFAELSINDVTISDNKLSKKDDFMPVLQEPRFENSKDVSKCSSDGSLYNGNDWYSSDSKGTTKTDQLPIKSSYDKGTDDISAHEFVSTEDDVSKVLLQYQSLSDDNHVSRKASSKRSHNQRDSSHRHSYLSETFKTSKTSCSTKTQRSHRSNNSKRSSSKNLFRTNSSRHSTSDVSQTYSSSVSNTISSKPHKDKKPNHTSTQTSEPSDHTDKVLSFKYHWQSTEPSNIASHCIDPKTLDVLTSYNPAVLAANDMMKYHLDLLGQHIQNSRRLYESYSSIDLNSRYKYTSVEDTYRYIDENKPNVLTYGQALKELKKTSKLRTHNVKSRDA